MTEKKVVDWELIERHYRAGLLSLRQICEEVGNTVTEGAIRKRAKKDGWTRDLKAKIQQRTEELLRSEAVRKTEYATGGTQETPRTQLTPVAERETVEANAQLGVAVRIRQREDAKRLRILAGKLLAELEIVSDNVEAFQELGVMLRTEDERGQDKRNDIYRRAIDAAGRIDSAKKLCEILEKLQKIEDEAYGLKTEKQDTGDYEEMLRRIGGGA